MADPHHLDPLVLGRRIRHYRRLAGLTLDQLGERVSKPASYLSLLENGKKEPRLGLLTRLSSALGVEVGRLLDTEPPTQRDALEIELLQAQESTLVRTLGLPEIKPGVRLDDGVLDHLVRLHRELRERSRLEGAGSEQVRDANGELTAHLASQDGYLKDVEDVAREALEMSGYGGDGPFSSRNLLDLTSRTGFEIQSIDEMPALARSIVDLANQRIYIAQRDELRTRQARKAVLQTLASFLLEHDPEPDLTTFLRQRIETAYFSAAVLVPEGPVVARLTEAKERHDIDVEDVKELFYVSYEMAAWRVANLLTRHLGLRSHLLVNDEMGIVIKGYANDGVPSPQDVDGGWETQRLCRRWGAVATFESPERFATHHQYTDTPAGTFFCTTHLEPDRHPPRAVTLGVPFGDARWFRGRETENRASSSCPDEACCRRPPDELAARWEGKVIVSARTQARILGLLAPDPYPELDMPKVLAVVEEHSES